MTRPNDQTIAVAGLILIAVCSVFVEDARPVVLPIATGLLGYLKGAQDAKGSAPSV